MDVWFVFLGIGDDDAGKDKASADDGGICEVASGPLGCGVTQMVTSAANEMMSRAGERHCPGCSVFRAEVSDSPWHFWFRRLSNLQMLHVCLFCMWYLSVREKTLSIKVIWAHSIFGAGTPGDCSRTPIEFFSRPPPSSEG